MKRILKMRNLTLILITLTLLSCGYNLKTDREIAISKNEVFEAQDELNKAKEQYVQLQDSLEKEKLKMIQFKDSIEFVNLTRIMCYQSNSHRHSCEIFGSQLITTTEKSNGHKSLENTYEENEVAMNE